MRFTGLLAMLVLALIFAFVAPAVAAPHWEIDITFAPPSPATQTGYHVQRKLGTTGTYTTLTATPLPAAATSYTDVGPFQDGQVVCIRVMAQPQNPNGSNVGAESCSPAPTQFPGQVGAPNVQWRWVPQ